MNTKNSSLDKKIELERIIEEQRKQIEMLKAMLAVANGEQVSDELKPTQKSP